MSLPDALLRLPGIHAALLDALPSGTECHLAGGALRNDRLGLPVTDFDFTLPGDPTPAARAFAGAVGGTWFCLDAVRRQSRVVLKTAGAGELTFDFAPWRAPDLTTDLRLRDFTANALACDIRTGSLVDPLAGGKDIAARLLRTCGERSLDDDPVRVLRALRLAQTLDFSIAGPTWEDLREKVGLLRQAPAERLGDELVLMLNDDRTARGWELLAGSGAAATLFNTSGRELPPRDRVAVALAAIDRLRAELRSDRPELATLLEAGVGRGLQRLGRLRLAAILRVFANPPPATLLQQRLALGRDTTACLDRLLHGNAAAADLAGVAATRRARALWADRFRHPADHLLFLAADPGNAAHRRTLLDSLEAWLALQIDGRVPPLVDGRWLAEHAAVEPGPQMGKILNLLKDAEIRGDLEEPSQVPELLRRRGEKSVDNENGETL